METLAPPVVAVIVTSDPGPWFEETLRSFAAQDYPELSVLVLDAASAEDPTPRVAAILPNAFVRRLPENRGFAASADAVLGMVSGASHLLLCHDDVALDPDTVHVMVEESFRSNAGVVAPKLVSWDDPTRLLHVGMAVDKGGAVVDRIEPGEIDHGQHDGVRDVFLAPGGCTLVRADLFVELGGFDAAISAMGDDLDLSWRAQVAGARVVVAPAARVRHLERLAGGRRPLPPGVPSLQALQRRHELRTVLVAYGRFHLFRVLPQLAALSVGEIVLAVLSGHPQRARAVAHAWRWNWSNRKELRAARRAVAARRLLSDSDVRRLQLHGSARLTTYLRRLAAHGLEAAHTGGLWTQRPAPPGTPSVTGLDGLRAQAAGAQHAPVVPSTPPGLQQGLPSGLPLGLQQGLSPADGGLVAPGHATPALLDAQAGAGADRRPDTGAGRRFIVWVVVTGVLLVGTRQLLGLGFPSMAGLLPLPSWSALLHRFANGWSSSGLGASYPTSPITAPLGVVALLLGDATGFLQKVVVLGCLPVGAIGMSRLARPLTSSRGRLAAAVGYLALPVAYDALALGRWDALVAYATAPWIVARLLQASGLGAAGSPGPSRPINRLRNRRLRAPARQALGLGILEALLCAMTPGGAALTLLMALGLAAGAALALGRDVLRPAARMVGVAAMATVVAAVLLAPWSYALLAGPARWQAVTGIALSHAGAPGWADLVRLAVGPIGVTPLAYGLVASAVLCLLIGVRRRLTWGAMAWGLVLSAWALAWAESRGWTGGLALDVHLLLVPAAVGVALAIGLGVGAFEHDLPGFRFGWHQMAAVLSAGAAVVGTLPVLAAAGSGRWDLPASGLGEATAWMTTRAPAGGFRTLWLGDPRVLPGGGWRLSPGLGYSVTQGGLPDLTGLWAGSSPGPAAEVGRDVLLAERHETVQLGQLLSGAGVHYVVVVGALAPEIPGYQSPIAFAPPAMLTGALSAQTDLDQVPGQAGLSVYVNTAPAPAPVKARPDASWAYRGGVLAEVVVWLGLAGYLARRRWLDVPGRRRRRRPRSTVSGGRAEARGGERVHELPLWVSSDAGSSR
jgi:GT2 family glycosyltransferase